MKRGIYLGALVVLVSAAVWAAHVLAQTAISADGMVETTTGGFRFPDGTVQVTAAATDTRRAFYLTDLNIYDGNDPFVACASGFHFTSIWEILDVSGLRYATDPEGGFNVKRLGDSGQGPPTALLGWVRTGFGTTNVETEGSANCDAWTEDSGFGTLVQLPARWDLPTGDGNPSQIITPWDSQLGPCVTPQRVWCVED